MIEVASLFIVLIIIAAIYRVISDARHADKRQRLAELVILQDLANRHDVAASIAEDELSTCIHHDLPVDMDTAYHAQYHRDEADGMRDFIGRQYKILNK